MLKTMKMAPLGSLPGRSALLTVLALCAVTACSTKEPESAQEYYALANEHFREGAYPMAIEHYRGLLDQYPFSELSEEAELKIAHAHFHDRSCPEAIAAFSDFQRRHPTSPYLPMVGYLIGRCNEKQMKSPDRDQSASQSAHAYYQAVINQYPESPFADLAEQRLLHTRENLAQHELNVASFYDRAGNRKAAEFRLIDLVRLYNDTDQAAEALFELGELYEKREEPDMATLAYAALLYHHEDHNLARPAGRQLDELDAGAAVGDPLAALIARSGRVRDLETGQEGEASAKPRQPSGAPSVRFNRPVYDPIETGVPNRRY